MRAAECLTSSEKRAAAIQNTRSLAFFVTEHTESEDCRPHTTNAANRVDAFIADHLQQPTRGLLVGRQRGKREQDEMKGLRRALAKPTPARACFR